VANNACPLGHQIGALSGSLAGIRVLVTLAAASGVLFDFEMADKDQRRAAPRPRMGEGGWVCGTPALDRAQAREEARERRVWPNLV
jgi:hypothetical protein